MFATTIDCSSSANSMHVYTRRLLQEASVAMPPAASTPSHPDAATQRPLSSGGHSSSAASPPDSSSPFNVSSQFSPTMVIILVILLSAFFFMGFFAIYVRRCTSGDNFSQRGNVRDGSVRRNDGLQHGLGVDPSMVESFPMVSYAAAKKKGCNDCVVCLAEFESGEELKQLPKCKHVFHPDCIGMWLDMHTTCPLCRRSLVNSDSWLRSWRWGGSSRGASLANEGAGGSSRSRRREDQSDCSSRRHEDRSAASPGLGQAGSSRGGQVWAASRTNEEESLQAGAQEEGRLTALANFSSLEIVLGESQAGCAYGSRSGRGVARNNGASRLSAEVSAPRVNVTTGRLGRSNSAGNSLRKDVLSRAAAAAVQAAPPLAGCMFPNLHRSRSFSILEEEEVMVDTTSQHLSAVGAPPPSQQ